jgi:hypothetical protein
VLRGGSRLEHQERLVPIYRLTSPGKQPELLEADYVRDEGLMRSLRGTTLVMGRPREIVVRRVPREVLVEEVTPQD